MSSIVLFWVFFSKSTNSESKKRIQAMFTSMFWCCSLTLCILRTKHCVRLAPSWLWAEAVFVPSVSLQGWVMSRVCLSVPLALLGLSCVSTAQHSWAQQPEHPPDCSCSGYCLQCSQWLSASTAVVICLQCLGAAWVQHQLLIEWTWGDAGVHTLQHHSPRLVQFKEAVSYSRFLLIFCVASKPSLGAGDFGDFLGCFFLSDFFSLQTLRLVHWWQGRVNTVKCEICDGIHPCPVRLVFISLSVFSLIRDFEDNLWT